MTFEESIKKETEGKDYLVKKFPGLAIPNNTKKQNENLDVDLDLGMEIDLDLGLQNDDEVEKVEETV